MIAEILGKAVGSVLARSGLSSAANLVFGPKEAYALQNAYLSAIDTLTKVVLDRVDEHLRHTASDVLRGFLLDDAIVETMTAHALTTPVVSLRTADWLPLLRERFAAVGGSESTFPLSLSDVAELFPPLLTQALEREASRPDSAIASLLDVRRGIGVEATLVAIDRQANRRALESLRDASRAAAAEIAVVDAGERHIRLDEGLYVERDVEADLIADLSGGAPMTLLIGDAGQGKTTLLWHVWRTLSQLPGREVWLIKPTRLFTGPAAFDRDHFVRAIGAARDEGREPVALFDTMDVLLHDEATIDAVRDLLLTLHRLRCVVVASTRRAEASILRAAGIPLADRALGNYNERSGELQRAITTHVHTFYGNYDPSKHHQYVDSTIASVAAGLPLRQVCLNPLTLRMLFVIYAPDVIPAEINVAQLFREYWKRRVHSDWRAGATKPHDEQSVAAAAEGLAITMLLEGTPEVDVVAAETILSRLHVDARDLDILESRGIVQRSRGKIAFFHQTFFEHAAARALLGRAGTRAIPALMERVRGRGFDPFLRPVLEQALLLGADDPLLRDGADDALHLLLDSPDVREVQAALGIFILREAVPERLVARVRGLIHGSSRTDHAAIISFLSAAANAPASRATDVLGLMTEIWDEHPGDWRIRQKCFALLERLASRRAIEVRDCIERIGAIDYALTELVRRSPESELRDVLRALAPHEPEWCWPVIVQLYRAAPDRAEGLRVKMLRLLAERAAAFGERDIASRFERETQHADDATDARDRVDFHAAWAKLWSIEWHAARLTLQQILDSIPGNPHRARGRLIALREHLTAAPVEDVRTAWNHVLGDSHRGRQSLAIVTLWAPFLAGNAPEDRHAAVRSWFRDALLDAFARDDTSWLRSTLVDVIARSDASAETMLEIFSGPRFADPAIWLSVDGLVRVVGLAYLAGHPAAIAAAERIAANPRAYTKAAELLLRALGRHGFSEDGARLFTALLEAAGARVAFTALEQLNDGSLTALAARREFLTTLSRWRNHHRAGTRKEATRILSLLVERAILPPPPFDELRRLLLAEQDPVHAGHIAVLIGHATRHARYDDLGPVIELLAPHVLGAEQARTNALEGLFLTIRDNPSADAQLERVFDLIMHPPTDQGRLKHARELLQRLADLDPRRAVARMHELLTSDVANQLGTNASRDLRRAVETPIRHVVVLATEEERQALARAIPSMNPYVAPAIVKALCDVADPALEVLLQEVAGTTNADLELRIRERASLRQRVTGSGRWPDVWSLVSVP